MRHHRHFPLPDIAIFILTLLLALLVLLGDEVFTPDHGSNLPAWCEHHDGHCPGFSGDPARSLDG